MKKQLLFVTLLLSASLNLAAADSDGSEVRLQLHSFVSPNVGKFAGQVGKVRELIPGCPVGVLFKTCMQGVESFESRFYDISELRCCQVWKDPLE